MKIPPAPVLATLIYHAIACIYFLTKIRNGLQPGGFGFGQLFAFTISILAATFLLKRSNIGRWLSIALFCLGAIYGLLTLALTLMTNGALLPIAPLLVITFILTGLSAALAFGKSTKIYFANKY